ncbi:MAG: type III pantothenate kinase [Flavobacteriales bacterium]|nr:type III pantothenate kinase [Flavobacteriales bacterium]
MAIFNNDEFVEMFVVAYDKLIERISELLKIHDIDKSIMSNVGAEIDGLEDFLNSKFFNITLTSSTKLPITIDYDSPETLGVDRRALAVAANSLNPNANSLVIDMGSCITYDVVKKGACYLGGAISPGMNMRFKAMHNFTESLPLVIFKETNSIIAKDTESSLINGVVFGISSEIDGYIDSLREQFGEISVFISGGDHAFFVDKLKNSIFADQKIIMKGLNIILDYNFKFRNEETTN